MNGSSNFMENLVYEVKMRAGITCYAPLLMRQIRDLDGVNEEELFESLHPKNNREQIFKTNKNSNSNDGGRSGSFFFFTQDKRFLVKTMTTYERKILIGMLPQMIQYLQ